MSPRATDGDAQPRRIAVGKITRAHGVHGEVSVLVLSEEPTRFQDGAELMLEDGRIARVTSSRSHQGRLLVRLEGVEDRDSAELLRGSYLFIDAGEVASLEGDAWWPHELEGCAVETDSGRELGAIVEILSTEANDVWVADGPDGEVLIPALRDVIVEVDVSAKRIVVREVEGLTIPEG